MSDFFRYGMTDEALISGTIYQFAGYLSSQDEVIDFCERGDHEKANEALKTFANKFGISIASAQWSILKDFMMLMVSGNVGKVSGSHEPDKVVKTITLHLESILGIPKETEPKWLDKQNDEQKSWVKFMWNTKSTTNWTTEPVLDFKPVIIPIIKHLMPDIQSVGRGLRRKSKQDSFATINKLADKYLRRQDCVRITQSGRPSYSLPRSEDLLLRKPKFFR